jgi:shikimate kinase
MSLFLIGYRGTGKTTVAALLAAELGCAWQDADAEIEVRAGRSIADIFAQGGEVAFRNWESRVLDELSAAGTQVLALGGGVILRPENRALLRSRGKTVWLTAQPETLWRRIVEDRASAGRRPNLTADGGLREVEQILAERLPLYRESADWVVDTEDKSPNEVARDILALVRQAAPIDPA